MSGKGDFKEKFNALFTKLELIGVKAANKAHRGFVNVMILFMAYNVFNFIRNYNTYWRLRRDPNIPRQWLEEQTAPGSDDWKIERERQDRDQRINEGGMENGPGKKRGFYD
eukprot:403374564